MMSAAARGRTGASLTGGGAPRPYISSYAAGATGRSPYGYAPGATGQGVYPTPASSLYAPRSLPSASAVGYPYATRGSQLRPAMCAPGLTGSPLLGSPSHLHQHPRSASPSRAGRTGANFFGGQPSLSMQPNCATSYDSGIGYAGGGFPVDPAFGGYDQRGFPPAGYGGVY